VAHFSRLSKIVIDVPPAEHDRELAFWNGVCVIPEPPGSFDDSNAQRWD